MGGTAPDLALHRADIILVSRRLTALPAAIDLARKARRIARANLAFAATVIAVLNGLRLLHHRNWNEPGTHEPK